MNKLEKLLWTGITVGAISIGTGIFMYKEYLIKAGAVVAVVPGLTYVIIADRKKDKYKTNWE